MVLFYFLTNITMFKWKVYIYKNINWKKVELEREFNNPEEFDDFRKSYCEPAFEGPLMWLNDWTNLQNYFNNLIDNRFGTGYDNKVIPEKKELPSWINFDKYEKELQKIEYKKAHKAEEVQRLKNDLTKLKDYKKKFEDEWRSDIVEQIDADIKSTQKALDALKK